MFYWHALFVGEKYFVGRYESVLETGSLWSLKFRSCLTHLALILLFLELAQLLTPVTSCCPDNEEMLNLSGMYLYKISFNYIY